MQGIEILAMVQPVFHHQEDTLHLTLAILMHVLETGLARSTTLIIMERAKKIQCRECEGFGHNAIYRLNVQTL